jgi:protein-arginine kinase activator protein McsA
MAIICDGCGYEFKEGEVAHGSSKRAWCFYCYGGNGKAIKEMIDKLQAENAALRSALEKAAIESATSPSGYALGYKDGWEDRKYNDILEAENAALREALRELVEADLNGVAGNTWQAVDEDRKIWRCSKCGRQAKFDVGLDHEDDCPVAIYLTAKTKAQALLEQKS